MKPIGPLMWEHRLIEKMLGYVEDVTREMHEGNKMDPLFVDAVIDFIRTYADRTHHGKEEDILFRDLAGKPLRPEHARVMDELMEEHRYARNRVALLADARERHLRGEDTLLEMAALLTELARFYPVHIEKEDKHFFFPCMDYFTREEQDRMLREFHEFDRNMIHEKYRAVADRMKSWPGQRPDIPDGDRALHGAVKADQK